MKKTVFAIPFLFLSVSVACAQGTITTIAGTGVPGFSGDGGPALAAQFNSPSGLALDSAGNLYVADCNNERVRKITPAGIITTVAGNGLADFTGENGRAISESLWSPCHVAVDSAGNLYISDRNNNRVRKVTPSGMMTTVAGGGDCCSLRDGGQATRALLSYPSGLALDAIGNLYIADYGHNRVRRVDPRGQIDTFAGYGGLGTATSGPLAKNAAVGGPSGLAIDFAGNLYVASYEVVRKITPSGTITTVAGGGSENFAVSGVPATSIRLEVYDLKVDDGGWVHLAANQRIFLVSPSSGLIYLLAGGGTDAVGEGIPLGSVRLAAGGIVVDRAGSIYLSDGHRIRKITR